MPLSIEEVKEKLRKLCDETTVLEILNLTIEDILERFPDAILKRYSFIASELEVSEDLDDEEANEEAFIEQAYERPRIGWDEPLDGEEEEDR